MNIYLMIGILLNTALIVINRFIYKLPNKVQLPLLILGLVLMGIGAAQSGKLGC